MERIRRAKPQTAGVRLRTRALPQRKSPTFSGVRGKGECGLGLRQIADSFMGKTGKRVGLDTATRMADDAVFLTDRKASGGRPQAATPGKDWLSARKRACVWLRAERKTGAGVLTRPPPLHPAGSIAIASRAGAADAVATQERKSTKMTDTEMETVGDQKLPRFFELAVRTRR